MTSDAQGRPLLNIPEPFTDDDMRLSNKRFRALVHASSDVLFLMNSDWSEMRQLDGRGFINDTEESRHSWVDQYIHPDDQPGVLAVIEQAISTKSVFELEHRVRQVDGSFGWALSRAVPILDEEGEVIEWFGAASDVTARHKAVEDLARMTAQSERQKRFYESLISSTPDLVYAFDLDYRFTFANEALLEMWNRTLDDSIGKTLIEVGYERWHAEMHEREIDQVVTTKKPIRGEVGFPHAKLGWRIYDYIFTPVLNASGEVESIAGTTRDITDIKMAEDRLKLLVNELNHRVKNTLATVQSIAAQTFRGDAADPRTRAAFEARLIALSDVHTLLTQASWEGANLQEIAGRAVAPFSSDAREFGRIAVHGEDVWLRPQVALALAMAFHELASNAVKYGALSGDKGRVALEWTRNDGWLCVTWRESDGPKVEPPPRRGFGSRLIETGLARELNGTAKVDYRSTGVVCTIDIPAPAVGAQVEPR